MKKTRRLVVLSILALLILALIFAFFAYRYYKTYKADNSAVSGNVSIYIPTGATQQMVLDSIFKYNIIKDKESFLMVLQKHKVEKFLSGHYVFSKGMSNQYMVNMIRLGWQKPIRVTFNSVRLPEIFAKKVSMRLELDSAAIAQALLSDSVAQSYGFTKETFMCMLIPNTYEVYWNASLPDFLDRMHIEYERFWTSDREAKAVKLGLTKIQVSILASIVQEETQNPSERSVIARVYINRLRNNMPFQACPTVKFALRQFDLRRILKRHIEFDSPYNTYKHIGFPPGPICIPSIEALDAVLNAPQHNYLYFCAKSDFSGLHNFSSTFTQHNKYAKEYQEALSKHGIYR